MHMSFQHKPLEDLLQEYPYVLAAGISSPKVQAWLEKHAAGRHVILSRTLSGPNVRLYIKSTQIKQNNAQILLLAGRATGAFLHYSQFSHAHYVLVPAGIDLLRPKMLLGILHYLRKKRIAWAGTCLMDGMKWLAFKVIRRKGHSERVYIPDNWGVKGFIERLNADDRNYVLLRWWERLNDWPAGDDADILISDADSLAVRAILEQQIGTYAIDLYSVSGGAASGGDKMAYYPPRLAEKILAGGRFAGGCRIPSEEDAFFSLAYHALYHKGLASGLPTETGLTPDAARRDFKKLLTERGAKLGYGPEHFQTMESIDKLLAEKGWQPPRDMLSRYSHGNRWVKKYFFGKKKNLPAGLCVFVLREAAERWGVIDTIESDLQRAGFETIERLGIPAQGRPGIGQQLRGGNWSPGPWPASGGLPAAVLIMMDRKPRPVRGKARKSSPNVDNANILFKNDLRDRINAARPEEEQANFIHTSDNTEEALDYIETIFGREKREAVYRAFLDLRHHARAA